MPKYAIIRVNVDPESDPDGWVLDYIYNWGVEKMTEGHDLQRSPQVTLEQYADFCDLNAQSGNNHEYVGAHRILAAVLHKAVGREQATMLMREIAEYGGLDGMAGVGGLQSAFPDFGIKDCWADWKLS